MTWTLSFQTHTILVLICE
uniref:Uncharacterized protein n=1 Tax=Anguilla anguilla TaxID=7936 RepID=A0A0E9R1D7_ANGAN